MSKGQESKQDVEGFSLPSLYLGKIPTSFFYNSISFKIICYKFYIKFYVACITIHFCDKHQGALQLMENLPLTEMSVSVGRPFCPTESVICCRAHSRLRQPMGERDKASNAIHCGAALGFAQKLTNMDDNVSRIDFWLHFNESQSC